MGLARTKDETTDIHRIDHTEDPVTHDQTSEPYW